MITKEQYTDLQILQGTDFSHEVEFSAPFDVDDYKWAAHIAKDYDSTAFSWDGVTKTLVEKIVKKKNDLELIVTLTDVLTSKFGDDFEGVWELVSKRTSDGEIVRQIQGDVFLSKGIVDTQYASNFNTAT